MTAAANVIDIGLRRKRHTRDTVTRIDDQIVKHLIQPDACAWGVSSVEDVFQAILREPSRA